MDNEWQCASLGQADLEQINSFSKKRHEMAPQGTILIELRLYRLVYHRERDVQLYLDLGKQKLYVFNFAV